MENKMIAIQDTNILSPYTRQQQLTQLPHIIHQVDYSHLNSDLYPKGLSFFKNWDSI